MTISIVVSSAIKGAFSSCKGVPQHTIQRGNNREFCSAQILFLGSKTS